MILLNARNPTQRQGLARRLLAPNKIESLQGSVKKVYRVITRVYNRGKCLTSI